MKTLSHQCIVASLASTIKADRLAENGQTLLLSLSGGVDSMVLLHAMAQLAPRFGWRLSACHINHQLRGAESDREAQCVVQSCERLAVPCRVVLQPISGRANLQARAREARYRVLHSCREAVGAHRLFTAHHGDDQLELFFIRLLSGSGLKGISGMPQLRDDGIGRPLLPYRKRELIDWAWDHQVVFVEDSSNRCNDYLRNRIRNQLLPTVCALHPGAADNIIGFMQRARRDHRYISAVAEELLQTMVTEQTRQTCTLDLRLFRAAHPALRLRILHRAVARLGRSALAQRKRSQLDRMAAATAGCQRLDLGDGLIAHRDYDRLQLWRTQQCSQPAANNLPAAQSAVQPFSRAFTLQDLPCRIQPPGSGIVVDLTLEGAMQNVAGQRCVVGRLAWPGAARRLELRSWRAGDRICLPSSGRHRKLSRFLIDRKIDRRRRQQVLVLDEVSPRSGAGESTVAALINLPVRRHGAQDGEHEGCDGCLVAKEWQVGHKTTRVLNIYMAEEKTT